MCGVKINQCGTRKGLGIEGKLKGKSVQRKAEEKATREGNAGFEKRG